MNPRRNQDATQEAISLSEVKDHLRITGTADNAELRTLIAGIRHETEKYLGRTLVSTTWELILDAFTDEIVLPMPPVTAINSISYVDTDGVTQTFSDYQFDRKGRLLPSYGNEWPQTRDQLGAVTIIYTAGDAHAGLVPPDIKLAMLLAIGSREICREDLIVGTTVSQLPNGSKAMLHPHREVAL